MALFQLNDKFGWVKANTLRQLTVAGNPGSGEAAINWTGSGWVLQKYNDDTASWENVTGTTLGTADQFINGIGGAIYPPRYYSGEVLVDGYTGYEVGTESRILVLTPPSITSAKLKLFATPFISSFYTELAKHQHGGSSKEHIHTVTGSTDDEEVTPPSSYIHYQSSGGGASHGHPLSTTTSGPSDSVTADEQTTTYYALNKWRKIYIDNLIKVSFSTDNNTWTDKDKNSSGWSELANVLTGTAEIECGTLLIAGTYNYIKFFRTHR